MDRESLLKQLENESKVWDFVVIGGGATGLGIAVDAASRGFSVALVEQSDFSKSTSSKSTKLVHGGVRYLAQGDVRLVLEALRERGIMRRNAAHLVRDQRFIIPCYRWWEGAFYTIGLTVYDLMAGRLSFGPSRFKRRNTVLSAIPTLRSKGLRGGVLYHDGQFDDSRMAVNLAQTASERGAVVLNYMKVTSLIKGEDHKVQGVRATDAETGRHYDIRGHVVVNATGVFVDEILKMDDPAVAHLVRPSQGVHVVLDRSFLGGDSAIMIPKTDDGRVLFAVPWHNEVVVGTTDTLRDHPELEPRALESEIGFILDTAGRYLSKPPRRSDVLAVFAGLRPLAAPKDGEESTKEISRSHKILVADSNLITITGGKWTTYRRMAEDTIDRAIRLGLAQKRACVTRTLKIHGCKANPDFNDYLYVYGTDRAAVERLIDRDPLMEERLHPDYDFRVGQVVWAVRNEMARTVEDVLSRRVRLTFLDARAAVEAAPRVAAVMARELGRDDAWAEAEVEAFGKVAEHYILR
ncbi:MAG: glycerol-3-phosphate dehydrogenase/oxidase [Rikenellaceae bacterium]|nr:glycerol-3-phosphate dehydrogenase/oxidase [Rikenellaceae bacterium]